MVCTYTSACGIYRCIDVFLCMQAGTSRGEESWCVRRGSMMLRLAQPNNFRTPCKMSGFTNSLHIRSIIYAVATVIHLQLCTYYTSYLPIWKLYATHLSVLNNIPKHTRIHFWGKYSSSN